MASGEHQLARPAQPGPCIAAMIVTYFPDDGLPQRLEALLAQVSRVVIVDNGSDEASLGPLSPYRCREGVTFHRNPSNMGVAAALNQGLNILADEGFAWVLTLDQDSTLAPDFISSLAARLLAEGVADRIALVGANRQDDGAVEGSHKWLRPKSSFPFFERVGCEQAAKGVTLVITSGTLTNVSAFRCLGGFREDFFVDLVDFEYCLRARQAGYQTIVNCGSKLHHRVGNKREAHRFGVKLSPTYHGASRKYYLFRNSTVLIGTFGFVYPHWLVYQLLALVEVMAGIVLVEHGKLSKIRACLLGIVDGVARRMGPARRNFKS